MKNTALFFWLLQLLIIVSPIMVAADEFINVVTEELKPLNYEENGEIKGTATEIVRKVLNKAGINHKIGIYPWARAYMMAQEEENTLIYTINRTEKRESLFEWIGLVDTPSNDAALYKMKNNSNVAATTLEEAKKFMIGVIRHDVNHEFLTEKGFTKIYDVSEPSQYVKMLLSNRVDMIIGSYPLLLEEFRKMEIPIDNIEMVVVARESSPYMAVSKKTSDKLINKIRKAYESLLSSGEIPDFRKIISHQK